MRRSSFLLCLVFIFLECHFPTVRMDKFEVHGIDVSHHQSRIAWDSIQAAQIHFAFVKATEGGDWRDSLFCYNWEEMEHAKLIRGAYHFYRPARSPHLQAINFLEQVHLEVGDLPPVLDVEITDGVSKEALIAGIKIWLLEMELHFNVKPIIYTNLKFYYQYLAGQFEDYPIWIARYREREPKLAAGKDWDFWQYGNRGRLAGINGDVDFNVFKGTIEELESYCIQSNVFSFAF
ncbi:MAG: glycoside hydrolase family 25 protein [Saprospiraceae bacterium]|nr:glycoside hydrolase family 25 protein [Saprospiraceae bacterium]